jgi:sulfate/thiosulfate transport system ATP-binding protein
VSIVVKDVCKRFGNFVALDNVSLDVPDGTLLALLGPSGSGKTTLLRVIAGLEVADSGSVLYRDEDITRHSARERQVGFVFQHYALFRHMTVAQNIGYGLKVRNAPKEKINARVDELLKLIRLETLQNRYPGQLSGGQRQRVALARALAAEPRVLLLDEPFGALDAKVRVELRQWLRRLHEEIHVTSIFVTHDQEEAFEVADRVVVMNHARIEQIGTPDEVYDHPASSFVYDFLGNVNHFRGQIVGGRLQLGDAHIAVRGHDGSDAPAAVAYVRPHEVKVHARPEGDSQIPAVVVRANATGPLIQLELERSDDGSRFLAQITRDESRQIPLEAGAKVFVGLQNVRVFPEDGGSYQI